VNAALELVNSEWWRGRPGGEIDKLADTAWLAAYAADCSLGELPPPTARELRELRELRSQLRALVEGGSDLTALDVYVRRAPVRRRVVAGELALEPVARGWQWALSEIAASYVALVADGEPGRIKVCANHECQWSFYDESKNRSRRWCGAPSCGTADKVRRFRERHRAAA
jgi:predicted RNA-binding Zn ribbon-like protein